MRGWVWLWILAAGCDRLLGLGTIAPVAPPYMPPSGASAIAAGVGHTCQIDQTGRLWCWGENDAGQLGIGSTLSEIDPPAPVGDAKWIAISGSGKHTCGLQADGSLWCWGDGGEGRLGTGDDVARTAPVQLTGTWRAVATGRYHTCAIDDADALWCWGHNHDGQVGDGSTVDRFTPQHVGDDFANVTAGDFHTCAIHRDGSLACWGANNDGQLGDGTNVPTTSAVVVGTDTWAPVSAGRNHTCGITARGELRCWGLGTAGQAGPQVVSAAQIPTPVLVGSADLTSWVGVAANGDHACAWTDQGQAYCWGDGSHGELLSSGATVNAPAVFAGTWTGLAVGVFHVCALDGGGKLSCAGSDGWGQLGDSPPHALAPTDVPGATGWVNVYAGDTATCAIDGSGHASCGGNNSWGQLGNGTRTSTTTPTLVMEPNGTWSKSQPQFAVGDAHACGVASSKLLCWGDNDNGAVGIGVGGATAVPALVAVPNEPPTPISAHAHTCAIDTGGALYCWGANEHGQLGDGTTTNRNTPGPPVGGTMRWLRVATGSEFTCALDSSSQAYCWGANYDGQAGIGIASDTPVTSPMKVSVAPGMTFTAIAAGGYHACALDNLPQAWCWGYNGEGQLGVGDFTDRAAPVAITSQRWRDLELGAYHTCGIDNTTGGLWCWGDDRRGELGLGDSTRAQMPRPTAVGSDTWSALAAGSYHTCGIHGGVLACWGSDDHGQLLDGSGWKAALVTVPVGP
ncbi:MAG: RCC1 domain-containing protein [Acidobacteriota bacterium]